MGFAAGFQVGSQAVERGIKMAEEANLKKALADESAKYGVTEGAYGTELQQNIQQLEGLKLQDPAQAGAYDQAIGELQRRSQMTAPDFSVASGATNFATRQEARVAAAPLRAEGLANVYRNYGYAAEADALEARGLDQQKTGLELNKLTRADDSEKRILGFAKFSADNPQATTAELKAAAFENFKFTQADWQGAVNTRTGIAEGEQKLFAAGIKEKLRGKNLSQIAGLYNADPNFDDKTDLSILPGKDGAVTLNFTDKATGKITGTQSFTNQAIAVEFLTNQALQPETLGSWMLNLRKVESGIDAQNAATRASDATTGLRNQQGRALSNVAAGNAEAQKIRADYETLTPEEQVGAVGQGLLRQFNMANARAGMSVPLGASPRAAKPDFNAREYATTIKEFTAAGFSLADARIQADQLYGRAPSDSNMDAGLVAQNKAKAVGTSAAPVLVQPGESRMTTPGAAVRAPLDQFVRGSKRGVFGGVEYFYTDPVTKRRYTTDEYNQLQTQ